MADTGVVTGEELADKRVNLRELFKRLSITVPIEKVKCKDSNSTGYDLTHPRRGLAIIISNGTFQAQDPRPYANVEIDNMREMFKKLGFDVMSFLDLTKDQILSVLEKAAKLKEYHRQSDCFACVIGSHGATLSSEMNKKSTLTRKTHVILGTDKHVDTNTLTDLFSDSECPGLRHKPKLFFIQACRKDSSAPPESGFDLGIDTSIRLAHPSTSKENRQDNARNETKESDTVNDSEKVRDDTKESGNVIRNILSKFRHFISISSLDDLATPVCRPNFMIMYSCPQDFCSFGREDSGSTHVRNPVVGGFLLHALYTVVVRRNLFVRQSCPEGLDLLELFTIVNRFGTNLQTNVTLPVGGNEEDKQRFLALSPFVFEHQLVGDVIFRQKNKSSQVK